MILPLSKAITNKNKVDRRPRGKANTPNEVA